MCLTPTDRSTHTLIVGPPGSGKTNLEELIARQDIAKGHSAWVIDGQGPLFHRLAAYSLSKGIDPVLVNPSGGEWICPYNPFRKNGGPISVQVDHRVQATLKAWGQENGDDTPRLERNLRCIYWVLIEQGLTILEASYLIATDWRIRDYLVRGIESELVKQKLFNLFSHSPQQFLNQVESCENRLMRFSSDDPVGQMMGVGTNALDIPKLMDEGGVVLVNLGLSDYLPDTQRRLMGCMLVTELFEHAMRRPKGARPVYLTIDEAGSFVIPEIGKSLDYCRQKGLHMTLSFQHLWQARLEDLKTYKSMKNSARTKIILGVGDRQDALELADDIFTGLADPEVKHELWCLSHRLEDTYLPTFGLGGSAGLGVNNALGTSKSTVKTKGRASTKGSQYSVGSQSGETSGGENTLSTESESWQQSFGKSETESDSDSEGTGLQHTIGLGLNLGLSGSVGLHPATKHIPFMEKKGVQFYSLEDRRWRAAEKLMTQARGHAIVRLPSGAVKHVAIPKPRPVLLKREEFVRLREGAYRKYSLPAAEATRIIKERQERLLSEALAAEDKPFRRSKKLA